MAEEVKYEMSLNDLVSGKLDNAEKHAQKFEGTLGRVKESLMGFGEKVAGIGETLGISFAFIKLEEFFHEGTELVHEFDIAEGQLKNTLKNVGERAGMTSEELVEMAQKVQHEIPFTTAQIINMENALSRFGNMTPAVYQKVLTASADIATSLKRDGVDVTNTLGRIMEAPAENGRLLRQLNITLTADQRKYLMQLERTGQVAKAQTFIFQELATKGYGGAARAAAESDPLFRYNKAIYELEMQIGKAGIALEETFAPGLEYASHAITVAYGYVQSFSNYIRTNFNPIMKEVKQDFIAVGIGVAVAGAAFLAANPGVVVYGVSLAADAVISGTLAVVTGVLTAAQWLLNAALTANPVGIVVVAIGALVTGLILAYQHSEKFRATLSGLGEIAKDIGGIFKGLGEMIWGALHFDTDSIKSGFETMASSFKDVGSAFHRGYTQSMAESALEDAAEKHQTTMAKTADKAVRKPGTPAMIGGKTQTQSKVTGTKQVNIHINIGALVKELKISTTNLKESMGKVHDMVAATLTASVNDSQLIADI